ncbi:hypothetical protein RUM43_001888 [Polyplax serrata]|uniref:Uncharacterized protein n=1 Tax=Polyplax serrata TaxID=468196 RepID=A0AAN8XQK0_POLSC
MSASWLCLVNVCVSRNIVTLKSWIIPILRFKESIREIKAGQDECRGEEETPDDVGNFRVICVPVGVATLRGPEANFFFLTRLCPEASQRPDNHP